MMMRKIEQLPFIMVEQIKLICNHVHIRFLLPASVYTPNITQYCSGYCTLKYLWGYSVIGATMHTAAVDSEYPHCTFTVTWSSQSGAAFHETYKASQERSGCLNLSYFVVASSSNALLSCCSIMLAFCSVSLNLRSNSWYAWVGIETVSSLFGAEAAAAPGVFSSRDSISV